MSISFSGNTITVGSYTLTATPTGFVSDGRLINKAGSRQTRGFNRVPETSPVLADTSGYFVGGKTLNPNPGPVTNPNFSQNISILYFSNDTELELDQDLSTSVGSPQASSQFFPTIGTRSRAGVNSENAGYIMDSDFSGPITKLPFATSVTFAGMGLTTKSNSIGPTDEGMTGCSSVNHGYLLGAKSEPQGITNIRRMPFAIEDTVSTDLGDLASIANSSNFSASHSSPTHGYKTGGVRVPGNNQTPNPVDIVYKNIDKFPFVTESNTTDVGELTQQRYDSYGISSENHGYVVGGQSNTASLFVPQPGIPTIPTAHRLGDQRQFPNRNPPFSPVASIDKFPFASDTNSVISGDITQPFSEENMRGATQTPNFGYLMSTPGAPSVLLHKFPFVSDVNTTSVGNLGPSTPTSGKGLIQGGNFHN